MRILRTLTSLQRQLLFFVVFVFLFGFTLFKPSQEAHAFSLDNFITSCTETNVAYDVKIRLDESLADVEIYRTNLKINSTNATPAATNNSNSILLWVCSGVGDVCDIGETKTLVTGSVQPISGATEVTIDVTATIRTQSSNDPNDFIEESVSLSNTCTIGVSPTPPQGCTPSVACGGQNNECLESQICNSDGECVVSQDCGCTYVTGQCGQDGCPPTHRCTDVAGLFFACVLDDVQCIPCTDDPNNPGLCGADNCSLLQRCIGGYCEDSPVVCASQNVSGDALCVSGNSNIQGHSVYTALGCIPVERIGNFTLFMFRWGLGLGGGIALIMIVVAAIMMQTSSGNPARLKAGREILIAALSGLFLLVFAALILEFIGVQVLGIPQLGI